MTKPITQKKKCCMCGSKKVVFRVGSGQRAVLNDRDYTEYIEKFYEKGDLLCGGCLFK